MHVVKPCERGECPLPVSTCTCNPFVFAIQICKYTCKCEHSKTCISLSLWAMHACTCVLYIYRIFLLFVHEILVLNGAIPAFDEQFKEKLSKLSDAYNRYSKNPEISV